ncbi:cytochrome P450, partial [Fomitopsis serialis]|uniref:cytochrome P450 n=1 Tax=Fomitopsis serialis TaxID=139415 RepID=UPI002008E53A
ETSRAGHAEDILMQSLLGINFASLHTSTIGLLMRCFTWLQALSMPSISVKRPMCSEGRRLVESRAGTHDQARSFLKESQQLNGISGITIFRRAMKDVTLSDGTYVPEGTILAAVATATHRDEANYENPNVFDPFRFSRLREEESERTKHHYVTTSAKDIGFGHGKHVWCVCPCARA